MDSDFLKRAGDFDADVLRRIDALIAERVMGWKITPINWTPTEDISAAWIVWEWLENHYGKGNIALMNNGIFLFETEDYLAQSNKGYLMSICIASLRVVGIDI